MSENLSNHYAPPEAQISTEVKVKSNPIITCFGGVLGFVIGSITLGLLSNFISNSPTVMTACALPFIVAESYLGFRLAKRIGRWNSLFCSIIVGHVIAMLMVVISALIFLFRTYSPFH